MTTTGKTYKRKAWDLFSCETPIIELGHLHVMPKDILDFYHVSVNEREQGHTVFRDFTWCDGDNNKPGNATGFTSLNELPADDKDLRYDYTFWNVFQSTACILRDFQDELIYELEIYHHSDDDDSSDPRLLIDTTFYFRNSSELSAILEHGFVSLTDEVRQITLDGVPHEMAELLNNKIKEIKESNDLAGSEESLDLMVSNKKLSNLD